MSWVITAQNLGHPQIGAVITPADLSTTIVPYGTIVSAQHPTHGGGEFIYLIGVASTQVGSWVTYAADDYSTALLAANAIGPVAVAMAATVANRAGWYQISGKASGRALTGFADNANVYATATAGSVDDAVVAGDRVKGARGASAVSSGLAEFEIARPYVDDITD